ncbi:MAG: hypothetical protein AAGP08_01530 [Pseudomonadota bacterium]
MKRTALALVALSLALPAFAHNANGVPHMHDVDIVAPDLSDALKGPAFKTRPVWSHRIDPSILNPKVRPIPFPRPVCLSCPPFEMERPGQILIQR